MYQKMWGIAGIALCTMAALVASPAPASAQMIGIGPRFSLIRGDLSTNTPTSQLLGGAARIKLSGNLSLEGAIDFKTTWDTDHTQRIREVPMQGSVLIFPIRSVIAPYAVAGMGIYKRTYDIVSPGGIVVNTADERKVGVHAGFGGEISIGKHAAIFLDYRYRFVKFGNDPESLSSSENSDSAVSKLLKAVPGLAQLNVSHQGSMWTGGVSFVF